MPRVRLGAARRQRKNRILDAAKGRRHPRNRRWRLVTESVTRGLNRARIDRKLRKRDYRQLWIIRVSAACLAHEISYSRFMNGAKLAGIALNRKMLSEVAIHDPQGFAAIVKMAKDALEAKKGAA